LFLARDVIKEMIAEAREQRQNLRTSVAKECVQS
jgi:hypothetical protein